MIDQRARYQKGLHLHHLFPSKEGECACGCGVPIGGRKKKWFSESCRNRAYIQFAIVKGDSQVIRWQLYNVDSGACRSCGSITDDWEADHILPVSQGGGGCDLSNYQTLCKGCHHDKHYKLPHQLEISIHAASTSLRLATSASGQAIVRC
jgi:hypothetical protein